MKTFKHLKGFIKKNMLSYILGIIILIAIDVLQLVMPKVLGELTDAATTKALTSVMLLKYIGIILGVALAIAFGRFGWRMLITGTSRRMEYWLRNLFFGHLEKLSKNYFNNNKTGDLMAHATNDIQAVRMAFGPGVVMMVDSIVLTILVVIRMAQDINLTLTLLALIPLPIIALMVGLMGKEIMKRYKLSQEAFGNLSDKIQENISGIRVIKSFVQFKSQYRIFEKANDKYLNKYMHSAKLFIAIFPLVMFISSVSFIIALGYGGSLVIEGTLTLGELTSFLVYLGLLVWPMMAIGMVINHIQRGSASMERLNKILNTEPEIRDINVDDSIDNIEGSIEIKGLTFKYEDTDNPALEEININIKKGETLAIIGRTGSGKTTLINLLLRNYNVGNGEIFIDGKDINNIPLKVLRENIGYVPQENFLFSKTIRDNIALYNTDEDFENIEQAAEIAEIKNEIIALPNKYETMLGERGVNLSGGQKQRTSIARAIVKNPKILILDDCLSAVDTHTEEKILSGLTGIMKDRTSIIISHRISTIKDSDKIIVLDEGRIIQYGSHEELLKTRGLYREIYDKQQLEENLKNAE
ncbi:ABC transporter ATP-binding protein [Oceanirhabdus sp. W0125-5]|uniref:ABC transporter ATP-binding protein n=1 Tax=Oceanirhabdus sp. W0125-5 TaxID=2999116 RepID=UPI0022F2ED2C|nr:ABC transporter ATP-binding protein [Oceanirhabdus sp. W0125-5]WBW99552.1 ABC transporter ATP-binding protein [Oceanirhabdus sp. W0125-5]